MTARQEYLKEYQKKYRPEHKEQAREYHNNWVKNHPEQHRESIRKSSVKYQKNHPEQHKKHRKKTNKKYRKNHQEQYKAEYMAYYHIPLKSYCEFGSCGSTINLQRAHMDYDYPLEVLTFCAKHHSLIDRLYRGND